MIGSDEAACRLEIVERAPRVEIVHHADERGVWASRGREILFRPDPEAPWERLARFPRASPVDALLSLRPVARALRIDRCNVHPTKRGGLLGIRAGRVYRIEGGRCVPIGAIQGDCLMNRAIAETEDGSLFFGEYFTNGGRRPVRIWRVSPGLSELEAVHTFLDPRVRHVHAVHRDPFEPARLWATSGDFDGECFLATTDDGFRTVELVGDGGQTFRAVGLTFGSDRLSWLTDSELEQNRVVSMDRATGRVATHDEVAASGWYAVTTSDGLHLATTTVEPGPAIRTRRAFLLASRDGIRWREVVSFRKDALPMPWFRFGSLALPAGRFDSRCFWLSGDGVVGLDGGSVRCALAEGAAG